MTGGPGDTASKISSSRKELQDRQKMPRKCSAILLVVVKVRMSDSEHLEGGSDTRAGGRMYTEVNRGTAQFNLNLFHSGEKQLTSGACRMDSGS